ncbi:MAG: phage tail protein [Acidimicrobiales bacterium]
MSDSLITTDPGLSVFFSVDVDGVELGSWTSCRGLGMEIETTPRGDTAMSFFMHQLSGVVRYTNLVLSRPISPDTEKVLSWFKTFSALPIPTAAVVQALSPSGGLVMTWELYGVIPVKWTGPSFDAGDLKVATEELELAYNGFL